jgi:hypothetical protein
LILSQYPTHLPRQETLPRQPRSLPRRLPRPKLLPQQYHPTRHRLPHLLPPYSRRYWSPTRPSQKIKPLSHRLFPFTPQLSYSPS